MKCDCFIVFHRIRAFHPFKKILVQIQFGVEYVKKN